MASSLFWSFDTPGGPVMVAQCMHPESNAERPDVAMGRTCPDHPRTVYLCLDNSVLWCDGGPGSDGLYHAHELELTSNGGRVLEPLDPLDATW